MNEPESCALNPQHYYSLGARRYMALWGDPNAKREAQEAGKGVRE